MRKIERTVQFRRDYKREMKGRHRTTLNEALTSVLQALTTDSRLDEKFRDHALSGNWQNSRDCHIKTDLVLIYQKPDAETLLLVRLGSHSELGI